MRKARGWTVGADTAAVIEERLGNVVDPCSTASVLPMSIVQLGLIRDVDLIEGVLSIHLRLTSPSCMMVAYIAKEVTEKLADLPGVAEVVVVPDEGLDWDPSMMDADVARLRAQRLVLLDVGARPPSA